MSFEESWRHYNTILIITFFPATFLLLPSISFALSRLKSNFKKSYRKTLLPSPCEIFKTKVPSKLALQSTDYCSAFTQSSYVKQY